MGIPSDNKVIEFKPNNSNCKKSFDLNCSNCSMSGFCLPKGLGRADLEIIDNIFTQRRLVQKGNTIFDQGKRSGCIYAVRSGSVKSLTTIKNGEEQILGFHLPGELIGFDGLNNQIHSCTAVALDTSTICVFPLDDLNQLCTKIFKLHSRLLGLIRDEIIRAHIMFGLLAKSNPEQRLATFFVNLSDRLSARGNSSLAFELTMSRYDIGSYLGLADETVSRVISKFRDYGYVKAKRRNITILNYESLCEISDGNHYLSH